MIIAAVLFALTSRFSMKKFERNSNSIIARIGAGFAIVFIILSICALVVAVIIFMNFALYDNSSKLLLKINTIYNICRILMLRATGIGSF